MTELNRLPNNIVPKKYKIELEPNLDTENFIGHVTIDLDILFRTTKIVLNADELEVSQLSIIQNEANFDLSWVLDEENQLLSIELTGELEVGAAQLEISFSGFLNKKLIGFYISQFQIDKTQHKMALTQFQAPHARKCFPCWDEPDFKAKFEISIIVSSELEAISNGIELSREIISQDKIKINFAETMPISTYLVACVVGPLEYTETKLIRDIPVRVVHRPGKGELCGFALEVAEFAINYLSEYFGIEYQGKKIDLVAVPDFQAGAMENQGCITFRETVLLIDENTSTQAELQRVTDVIAHELAHMWFGNLVTLKWWNGLWLNEAFATFMEMKVTDAFKPEWNRWVDFSLSKSEAYKVDSTTSSRAIEYEVNSPDEAEGMFDLLTYEKGGSLVRMLEQFIGEDKFKKGLQLYMRKNKFLNTETNDLWDAIEIESGEPVRTIMNSWIFKKGFPILSAEITNNNLKITQDKANYLGSPPAVDETWSIPIKIRTVSKDQTVKHHNIVFESEEIQIDTSEENLEYVLINEEGNGFLKVIYSDQLNEALLNNLEKLSSVERYNLIEDSWSGVLKGNWSAAKFLNLLESMAYETDRSVWLRIIRGLADLSSLVIPNNEKIFEKIVQDIIEPQLKKLKLAPIEEEELVTSQLRGDLIKTMGVLGNEPYIQAECKNTVAMAIRNPELIDPSVMSAAIYVTAHVGDEADFNDFLHSWEIAENPQEELRFLSALAHFRNSELHDKFLELIKSKKIRAQTAPFLLRTSLLDKDTGLSTWVFIEENWQFLLDYFSEGTIVRMLSGITSLDSEQDSERIKNFLANNPVPVGQKTLDQTIELLDIQVCLKEREEKTFNEFLQNIK